MTAEVDSSMRLQTDDVAARTVLPGWHEVFAALCGRVGDEPGAHPVTRCARRLAELHAASQREPDMVGVHGVRMVLIASIDDWVAHHAPHAARCGESLGRAADRLAQTQQEAVAALRNETDEECVHAVWHALGLLATEWSDLVDEVMHGQKRMRDSGH
ncbi:hypothetical protein ACWDUL_05335 [Nocardia niigatensis]|uniref:hypothetical protein n=1 Tax=Nocardia niigatensis TaxID=209249 RepID=UPI0012F6E6B1|nr:hypothetical protein [Nocardia niigatensis]